MRRRLPGAIRELLIASMRRRFRHILVSAGLLGSLLAGAASSQEPPVPEVVEAVDTLAAADVPSARTALIRSFIIPGWGQAYVGAPGRGAFYFGVEAGSLWMIMKSRRQLSAAGKQQAWLREQGALAPTEQTNLVEARAQQVEDWIALAIFTALLSGADAFVAAQLADFTEHIGVEPVDDEGLELRVSLPLGSR